MNLTEREQKMLAMLAQGKSGAQIAKACKLTEGTCRVYLHNMYRKMGVANRAQAVAQRERKLVKLVQTMRDLIAEAITQHIYDEDNGDKIPADCPYTKAVAAADALLGSAGERADAPCGCHAPAGGDQMILTPLIRRLARNVHGGWAPHDRAFVKGAVHGDVPLAECDNCAWVGPMSTLRDIKHYHERVDGNTVEPDGECPLCGALAYEVA